MYDDTTSNFMQPCFDQMKKYNRSGAS